MIRHAGACRFKYVMQLQAFGCCRLIAAGIGLAGTAVAADRPAPSIWQRETLTGDWGGARSALKDKGIEVTLNYIAETFSVLSGGIRRAGSYGGRAEFSVDADLEKLVGWAGGSAHVTVFNIHSSRNNVSADVGGISNVSNIDAVPTTRLFTLWIEQNFNDRFSIRAGQLAADDEFFGSPTAGGLLNGTFGWASVFDSNMINSGPSYPLATPGVRVKANATENLSVLAAVFAGDPTGPPCGLSAQECNETGTTFSTTGGTLWIGEMQYAINQGKQPTGMPGVYKLGAWYATTNFADQRYGVNAAGAAVLLSDATSVGPLNHAGNWGVYGVADQMVARSGERSLNLFLRGGVSPSDRNLLSYSIDGGVGIKGLFAGRPDDTLTLGVAYAKISKDASAADQDLLNANGPPQFIRNHEVVFELSYAAQLAPWWVMQPDLQYIVHPGGNVADPNNANAAIANAFVAGLRSTIKF